MTIFDVGAVLIALAAIFGYINHRWLKLPSTIGLMLIALVSSICVMGVGFLYPPLTQSVVDFMEGIDFNEALMHGMLSFLLFAGALHVNLGDLAERKWTITLLATAGLILSTAIVGFGSYYLFQMLGLEVPLLYCMVFGALISPTDPVAVLGILKTAGASKSLQAKIAGESLFNDGVGVVVFAVILSIAQGGGPGHATPAAMHVAGFFLQEAVGGIILGLLFGHIAYRALKSIDDYTVEIMITLALVMFTYAVAFWLHTSGPLAVVVAGLMIGNHGKQYAMSDTVVDHLDKFWMLIDEIMNAILFLLIGLEFVIIFTGDFSLTAAFLAIPLVLVARLIAVTTPIEILRRTRPFSEGAIPILTWGGLRGGISVALALSLPKGEPSRDIILACTYVVVLFSILVQGLTIRKVIEKYQSGAEASDYH